MNEQHEKLSNKRGFTLVEIIIGLPLIFIICILTYNMIFLVNKSYRSVNDSFAASEELRIFQINIQKEANEAKKAEDTKEALHKVSDNELYIYTFIDEDDIPELIIYKLKDEKLYKFIKAASNDKYPYIYDYNTIDFSTGEKVLSNVKNTDLFGNIESVKPTIVGQEGKDNRKKTLMKIEIETSNGETISIQEHLVTKSRAAAD